MFPKLKGIGHMEVQYGQVKCDSILKIFFEHPHSFIFRSSSLHNNSTPIFNMVRSSMTGYLYSNRALLLPSFWQLVLPCSPHLFSFPFNQATPCFADL